jgi:hypothetical protein
VFGTPVLADEPCSRDWSVGIPYSAERGTAAIESLHERHGFDRLFFWARLPGLALEPSTRSLELFAEHVLPHFS